MIIQNKSKQAKIDSWVHKLLLRDMKKKKKIKKTKNQPTNNHKNNRKLKNNRKIKAMRNITPTMDQYSRNGQTGETDP